MTGVWYCYNQEMGMMTEYNEFSLENSTENYSYNSRIVLPRVENFPKVSTSSISLRSENKSKNAESFNLTATAPYIPSPISEPESPKRSLGRGTKKKQESTKSHITRKNVRYNEEPNVYSLHEIAKSSQENAQDEIKLETNNGDNLGIQQGDERKNEKGQEKIDLRKECVKKTKTQNVSEPETISNHNSFINNFVTDNIEKAKQKLEQSTVGNEELFVPCKKDAEKNIENIHRENNTENRKDDLNSTSGSNKNGPDSVSMYKSFLENKIKNENDSDDELSPISSISDSDDNSVNIDNNLVSGTFEPLYSTPLKNKTKQIKDEDLTKSFDKIIISNSSKIDTYHTGSLPELYALNRCKIKRVSHVMKNDSEPDSEPGATIRYKVRPLPLLPNEQHDENEDPYDTIDKISSNDVVSCTSGEKRTFKQIATLLTLVPRVPTKRVRDRKNDHDLADILKYLPDRKLKIFVGTWNMKGTKDFPSSLDDFLLPPESEFLQDVYVIGTQEGTPFRHEWQLKLQETFGPSHVLVQASNFGVLQLSVFVRRELVWFCSNVDQDTIATRVGHKIKTKGALAMTFSIFGSSFLFITSHFTSHEGKLRERINDYNTISQNLNLIPKDCSDEPLDKDVTNRFDRVFWFGDFNFRVRKTRIAVDKLIRHHEKNRVISELLSYDQLKDVQDKIFYGFEEAPIRFMPTYKFDVHTDIYDTSSKQRVPSWTDRVMYKSVIKQHLIAVSYNSCDTIKNSDHRPVYAIFETRIEPFKSRFVVSGGQFNRDVYVEANMRRNAPIGSQSDSHVCTIL